MADQSHNRKGFFPKNPNARIEYLPIAASQTLSEGDAVILSSGQVAIGLAASATLCGVVAQDCSSLAAGTLVPVYADPYEIFIGLTDADSSSLAVGAEIDLVGATGAMLLDVGASTTDVFKVLRECDEPEQDNTAASARWEFVINKHAFARA